MSNKISLDELINYEDEEFEKEPDKENHHLASVSKVLLYILGICLLVVSVFVVSYVINSIQGYSCEFNNMKWGTQKERVIKKLGKPVSVDDNNILYYDFFMDNSCDVWYYFNSDNRLNKINVNLRDAVIYNDLKSKFTEKYGKPKHEENDSDLRVAEWGIGHTTIDVFLFDGESHVEYSFAEKQYEDISKSEDVSHEETVDNLKAEVIYTYNRLYDITSSANDLCSESIKAITDNNISQEEAYKITNKNDELIGEYFDEVSKYLDNPTYDDDYALAVYEYLSSVRIITLGCYSYALSGNAYYLNNAKIEINNLTDKFGEVMLAQNELPKKAGYTLVDIIVDSEYEETTLNN